MEPFTIITGVTAVIGAVKSLIDIHTSSKVLLVKKEYSIFDELNFNESSEKILKRVYNSLKIGNPKVFQIVKKLIINYSFFMIIFIAGLLTVIAILFDDEKYNSPKYYFLILIVNYLLFRVIFPNPLKPNMDFIKWDQSNFKNTISNLRFYLGRILLTKTEFNFLTRYLKLNRFKDSIETHLLANSILKSDALFDQDVKKYKKWMVREEIIAFLKENRLNTYNDKKWFNENRLPELGISRLKGDKADVFYEADLCLIYDSSGSEGLIKIIDDIW